MILADAVPTPDSWLQLAGQLGTVGVALVVGWWLIVKHSRDMEASRTAFDGALKVVADKAQKESDAFHATMREAQQGITSMSQAIVMAQKELLELRMDLKQEK